MTSPRSRTPAAVLAIALTALLTAAAQAPPDVIRVKLSRNDQYSASVGNLLTFDAESVTKAKATRAIVLPERLPDGAAVGFNSADDSFAISYKPESGDGAMLVVDANANGDLRDDTPVHVARRTTPRTGTIVRIRRTYPGSTAEEAWLPYRFEYSPRKDKSGVEQPAFFVSAAYRMDGTADVRGVEYVVELSDYNLLGRFDKSNLSRGTVLRVYAKGAPEDERPLLWGYELIALGDEFYEVTDGALDGSWIDLKRNTLAQAAIGRAVPAFRLTDTDNATFSLGDYRGRYLLLDFWPSWCGPCIAEFPNIKKAVEQYPKELAIVGINLDTEKALGTARKIVAEKGLTWRHVMEGRGYFLPIYQILGRLPERRMAFPLYVAIAPDGVVQYATNDFAKMRLFLDDALAPGPSRGSALFVPMAPADRPRAASPLPVDFGSAALTSLLARPQVKMPPGVGSGARVGRLPNDVIVIARPGASPDRHMLRVDANRDFDLTNDEEKEIPVVDRAPSKLDEFPEFGLQIAYASGSSTFRPFRFFALRPATDRGAASIFYVGWESRATGSFVIGGVEYQLSMSDPTSDLMWSADDLTSERTLVLREKRGGKWLEVSATSSRIPLAGRLFRVAHVHDDGQLLKLEPISSP